VKAFYLFVCFFLFNILFLVPFSYARDSTKKAQIKNGYLYRKHCWRKLGLGMISNNPSITMAERMAFSHHINPSSHIVYI
jgi:hypothetical protein